MNRTRSVGPARAIAHGAVLAALGLATPLACNAEESTQAKSEAASSAQGDSGDTAIKTLDDFAASSNIDKSKSGWKTALPMPPKATFDAGSKYYWDLQTNVGPIVVKLMPDVAPMHVSSTIYLTRLGFYDDILFHRVIPGFMAQAGDPLGRGSGGPGYSYDGETSPKVRHDRPGLLSMANTGRPRSDGSQFFLTFVPTPHLDGKHTIFGAVVEGMATVKQLEAWRTPGSPHQNDPLKIEKATIRVE